MNPQSPSDPEGFLPRKDVDVRKAVLQGGLWIFLGRWSIRSIGIVSTIILARLLAPEDFGLIAICLLVIGLAETVGKEGQNLAVIRRQNLNRAYTDSAWTASIITGLVLGVAVVIAAPFVAEYFNEPRALLLIQILSIRVFIMGLENIGLAINRKEFNFLNDFKYNALGKIIPVSITIVTAYFVRNYWALVAGSIVGHVGAILASYVLSKYRPRLCFQQIREVWSFSIWVVLEKFAFFCSMRIDQFFIPAVGNTTQMGHYHVGSELARMPLVELFMPIDRVLIPAYSYLLRDLKELRNAYINALSVATAVCLPVGIGFSLVAHDAVRLIYGEKWIPMVPVVEIIAVSSVAVAIISTVTPILNVLGRSTVSAGLICLQALLLLGGLLLWQSQLESISDIAWVRLSATMLTLPAAMIGLRIIVGVSFAEMLKAFWRPVAAAGAMILVLLFLLPPDLDLPDGLRLIARVAAGGGVYAGALMLLWVISGKPPGIERAVSRTIATRLGLN